MTCGHAPGAVAAVHTAEKWAYRPDSAIYVVTETDAPQGGDTRCKCTCVFDLGVRVSPVVQGVIALTLVRTITDLEAPDRVLFDGQLDLADGEGRIVVDETVAGPICGPVD